MFAYGYFLFAYWYFLQIVYDAPPQFSFDTVAFALTCARALVCGGVCGVSIQNPSSQAMQAALIERAKIHAAAKRAHDETSAVGVEDRQTVIDAILQLERWVTINVGRQGRWRRTGGKLCGAFVMLQPTSTEFRIYFH